MEKLFPYAPERCGWYSLPTGSSKTSTAARAKNKRRDVILTHLGAHAKSTATDTAYSSNTGHRFAWIHLHPEVHRLAVSTGKGLRMPERVPRVLGTSLNAQGFSFSERDELLDGSGDYHAAPNHLWRHAKAELQHKISAAGRPAPAAVRGDSTSPSAAAAASSSSSCAAAAMPAPRLPARLAASRASASPADAGAQIAALQEAEAALLHRITELEAKVQEREGAAAEIEGKAAFEAQAKAAEAFTALLVKRGGLCRTTLTDPAWHEAYPGAASHLFGFKSWKETKLYVWALWPELSPPPATTTSEAATDHNVTPFEKCLIAKMRIHRGFPLQTLSLMWGRDRRTVGRYVEEWVPKWGVAGEDLSILDISAEFLEETCPESYKAVGLTKVSVRARSR